MKIDIDALNQYVKPALKDTNKSLQDAKSILNTIIIPNDFYYYSRLRSIPNTISYIEDRVNEISKWLEQSVGSLENVEKQNDSILGNLTNSILKLSGIDLEENYDEIDLNKGIQNTNKAVPNDNIANKNKNDIIGLAKEKGEKLFDYWSKGWDILRNNPKYIITDEFQETAAQIADDYKQDWLEKFNKWSEWYADGLDVLTGGNDTVREIFEQFSKRYEQMSEDGFELITGANKVAGKILEDGPANIKFMVENPEYVASGKFFTDLQEKGIELTEGVKETFLEKFNQWSEWYAETMKVVTKDEETAANITNVTISVEKGVMELIENVGDTALIMHTGTAVIATKIVGKLTGKDDEYSKNIDKMWDNTMSYVAEEQTVSIFNTFYNNYAMGKWLDETSGELFKSDGTVYQIVTGFAYVGGTILLTTVTFGANSAARFRYYSRSIRIWKIYTGVMGRSKGCVS